MKKRSDEKDNVPSAYESILLEIAAKEAIEGKLVINQKSETYPATNNCTFLRFDVTGEHKFLCVVIKLAHQDLELRSKFMIREKFLNEAHFYSQVVPKIRPILDKWNDRDDEPTWAVTFVPNYYAHDATEGQEWLAIEDIGVEFVNIRNIEDLDKWHSKFAHGIAETSKKLLMHLRRNPKDQHESSEGSSKNTEKLQKSPKEDKISSDNDNWITSVSRTDAGASTNQNSKPWYFKSLKSQDCLLEDKIKTSERRKSQFDEPRWFEIITKVVSRSGFRVNEPSYDITQGNQYPTTGNHSDLRRFILENSQGKIGVVLKRAVEDPITRGKNHVTRMFRNEVTFYDQVVNRLEFALTKQQRRCFFRKWRKDVEFPKIPRLYDSDLSYRNEYLLLEDIDDYFPCENPQNLDKKHLRVQAGIQALAAFHSASLNWKTANPTEFMTVAKLFTETEMFQSEDDPTKDMKTQKINAALGAACRISAVHLSGPYSVCMEKIYNSVFVECPLWVSMEKSEPWSVITHGDCWAKNFLFKYDKNKKIIGVALVDFKCARAASPLLDVTNFLLSSGSPDCLRDLRPFIEKHKDSITPKISDYRQHVRLFGCYGLVAAMIHHYYGVLYPTLDLDEATHRIVNLEDMKTSVTSAVDEKTPTLKKQSASTGPTSSETTMRVALVVKAAHDVRMI